MINVSRHSLLRAVLALGRWSWVESWLIHREQARKKCSFMVSASEPISRFLLKYLPWLSTITGSQFLILASKVALEYLLGFQVLTLGWSYLSFKRIFFLL